MRLYIPVKEHRAPDTPKLLHSEQNASMAPPASDQQISPLSLDTTAPVTSRPSSPPLISPARPINPPEQWYAAPTLAMQTPQGSTSSEVSRRRPPTSKPESGHKIHPQASGVAENPTSALTPARPAGGATATAAAEEAYWRVGCSSSELGPGEGWYAQQARGNEAQATPLVRENDDGDRGKGMGDYEREERGGTRELGPGVEWYL